MFSATVAREHSVLERTEDFARRSPCSWSPGCPSELRHIHLICPIYFFKTLDSFFCEVQRRQTTSGHQEQTRDQKIKWDNEKNKSRKKDMMPQHGFSYDSICNANIAWHYRIMKKSFPVPPTPLLLVFFLCLYEGDHLDQGINKMHSLIYVC